MLPDRVSNPGPLTYESGALLIALRGPAEEKMKTQVRLPPKGFEIISIFHGCMVWIEKSVMRITDQHHEACLVMLNSDPE